MRLALALLLSLCAACGKDEPIAAAPEDAAPPVDAAIEQEAATQPIDSGPDVVNACEDCSEPCAAELGACQADSECQAMLDCVYGRAPGCPLGPTGAACVAECARAACTTDGSVKLFYAAELCSYCGPACTTACAPYCSGFTVDAGSAVCWADAAP